MNKKSALPDSKKHKASDIEIKFPRYYAKFLQYLLTRETAYAFDKVLALVPKKSKSLSEIRLALDSTKYINDLEDRINAKWDQLSEAIWSFINDPYNPDERENFQKLSKELYDISQTAIAEINSSYDFTGETQSRLLAKVNSLVDVQIGDLDKAIVLQYQTAVDSYPDEALVAQAMSDALFDVVDGAMTTAGPLIVAAQTINDGRDDASMEIDDEVESYTFTNDSPVTDICTELNGRTFSKDDPEMDEYSPPLHYNCDSYWIINLKSYTDNPPVTDEDLILSKKAQGQINLHEGCCEKQDDSIMTKYLLTEWKNIRS